MLLDAHGNLARRRELNLTPQAVRCLVDGRYFVRNLPLLVSLYLEPYCRVCGSTITAALGDDKVVFRCGHLSGHVRTDRPSEVEPLLDTLGWNIRCTACKGDVRGDNSKGSAKFVVQCTCTTRELDNPLVPVAQPTPERNPRVSLDSTKAL